MSSGETTLSGNSRLRSSNVRYFLSPPSSSSRSITSSRSLSSILLTVVTPNYFLTREPFTAGVAASPDVVHTVESVLLKVGKAGQDPVPVQRESTLVSTPRFAD